MNSPSSALLAVVGGTLMLFSGCAGPLVPVPGPLVPTDGSQWNSVSASPSGEIYGAGSLDGFDTLDLGAGVRVAGANAQTTAVIVKFTSEHEPVWARTSSGGWAEFAAVSAGPAVYAAGQASGEVVWAQGLETTSSAPQGVIVKYDSSGNVVWAREPSISGGAWSQFNAVAVDAVGSVYVAGSYRASPFNSMLIDFGGGVSLSSSSGAGNVLVVKYDPEGTALWARTETSTGDNPNSPFFYQALAVGQDGVYAAGSIDGQSTADFGSGVSVTGNGNFYGNAVLVKYSADGGAIWARTQTSGANSGEFRCVALDGSGVYVGGTFYDTPVGFGNGVTLPSTGGKNVAVFALLKYDSSGQALWARHPASNSGSSVLLALVSGPSGISGAGWTESKAADLGNGVAIEGLSSHANPGNLLLVRYDSDGTPLQIHSAAGGTSYYHGLMADGSGILAAGAAVGTEALQPGGGTIASRGTGSPRGAVLVRY